MQNMEKIKIIKLMLLMRYLFSILKPRYNTSKDLKMPCTSIEVYYICLTVQHSKPTTNRKGRPSSSDPQ